MLPAHARRGFTWKELVAILAFLAIVLGILFPAVQQARERARRNECANNMKQIGLGLHNYYDARKIFPPSADLRGSRTKKEAGGWSFLFKILPNMEYGEPYSAVNPIDFKSTTVDPLTDNGAAPPGGSTGLNAIAYARDTSINEFICQSNPNQIFEVLQAPTSKVGVKYAVTNYKALGATSMESLLVSVDPDGPLPYGDKSQHPDGVLFPAANGLKIDDIKDGLANTAMVVETMDYWASTWIAGSDVNLVGMNKASSYFKFQDRSTSYWAPLDFIGKFDNRATPSIQAMRTFLAYDFRADQTVTVLEPDQSVTKHIVPIGKDGGTYPVGVGRTPAYGPSSAHPDVVNHLFCDGSVRGVRKDVDYAAYFFAITRDGGDQGAGVENE